MENRIVHYLFRFRTHRTPLYKWYVFTQFDDEGNVFTYTHAINWDCGASRAGRFTYRDFDNEDGDILVGSYHDVEGREIGNKSFRWDRIS